MTLALLGTSGSLSAQTAPPAAAPVVAQPPAVSAPSAQPYPPASAPPLAPPGYPPPPPGYRYVQVAPPQPVLAPIPPPPAGYQLAPELPYVEGEPIPIGYRVVEEPRYGLVTAGWVLSGVSYGISVMTAISADFKNESSYLLVPFFGPWLVMGRRDYGHCSGSSSAREGLRCTADVFVVMGLTLDGLIQAGGGAMLLSGYLAQRKKLVRGNAVSWNIGPRAMGTGYGLSAFGTF